MMRGRPPCGWPLPYISIEYLDLDFDRVSFFCIYTLVFYYLDSFAFLDLDFNRPFLFRVGGLLKI